MRKLILAALICFLQAKDFEEIYLEGGLNAVKSAIEANLQSKDYWIKKIGAKDVEFGLYPNSSFIIVVDKTAKKLELFSYDDGNLTPISDYSVITGLMGDKLKEGDLKTPVGAYHITRKFTPSDDYYGPVAFSLSYPNLYDKARLRDGSGIWIHGHPRDGGDRLDSAKTKGCVVLQNTLLSELSSKIGDKGGVVLINENGKKTATKAQIATILGEIFRWKAAWSNNDASTYLSFYDAEFRRFDAMKLGEFTRMKKAIFAKNEAKQIQFNEFSVTPYPSTENGEFFRVSFFEKYWAPSYKFNGYKTLYLRLDGDKIKILTEE